MADIKLYLGDCLEILPTLEAGSVDAVITSPPYYNAKPEYSEWDSYEDYLDFMNSVICRIFSVLKPHGRVIINIPDGYSRNPWMPLYADVCKIMQKYFFLRGSIVWNKQNGAGKTSWGSWCSSSNPCLIDEHEMILVAHKEIPKIKGNKIDKKNFLRAIHSVWNIKPTSSKNHPAVYPVELVQRALTLFTDSNFIILDPFMGSGTTGVACVQLNRNFIGIEIEPKYYKIAEQRIKQVQRQQVMDF